jgi:exosortase
VTSHPPVPSDSSLPADDVPARIFPTLDLRRASAFIRLERRWLFILVPYLLAWAIPLTWCWPQWGDGNHPQCFQLWMPLLTGLLIWSNRNRLTHVWRRVQERNSPSFWERGNGVILAAGCLLLLFAHLVQIKGVAVAALILIAVGVLYQVYGLRVLRSLWAPLLFLLLMIPPPDSLVDAAMRLTQTFTVRVAALALRFLHVPNTRIGWTLRFYEVTDPFEYPKAIGGLEVLIPTAVLALWFVLYRRRRLGPGVRFIGIAAVTAVMLSVARAILVGFLFVRAPQISRPVMHINGLAMVFLSFALALAIDRGVTAILALRRSGGRRGQTYERSAVATRTVLRGVGRSTAILILPFEWMLRVVGYIGVLWKRSERGIEGLFRAIGGRPRGRGRRRR